MAEIMVLTLFILLLIVAVALERHRKELERNADTINKQRQEIKNLLVFQKVVTDNPNGVVVKDIVQQLSRQKEDIARLEAEAQQRSPTESSVRAFETLVSALTKESNGKATDQQIRDKIKETSAVMKESETLKGQIAQLRSQIKASGRGNEFPSCWVTTPEGKIESIFELLMSETGIRIIERPLPHRAEDKAKLPLSAIRYNTEYPRYEFEALMRPLYEWSVAHECRFYVITASSELSAPISLVNAINGYFYPDGKIHLRTGA
ncbi:protein of unknown function [Nitrospira japonica]|uniref:Uncharacterized protein n=1 Tax=Nitrospira japonica TaxID=1325564 RepID=A0A1W1I6E9_9BACT|nr:hypothetical protein [Nitrospira japonica]SLM48413.1 protein of unknown function [Nitrospira japonica]